MTVEVIIMQGGKARAPVTITATALFFSGFQNVALTPQTVTPSGGVAPYTFTAVNFPTGVTVGAASGIVSGTPTVSGNITNASVTVTDSAAHTASIPVFFALNVGEFSDTLLRTSFTLGTPWIIGVSDPSQAGWFNYSGGIFTNGATGLNLKNPTGGGSSCSIPIPLAENFGWGGLTQFAECTVVSVSAFGDSGPAVSLCGDSMQGTANGYFAALTNAGNVDIRVGNVGERVVAAAVTTWLANDVIRIAVVFNAGSNDIKISKNGTLISTTNDANAARPIASNAGICGFYFKGASAGAASQMKNFRGGLGLGS